jgi:hypothetical protein
MARLGDGTGLVALNSAVPSGLTTATPTGAVSFSVWLHATGWDSANAAVLYSAAREAGSNQYLALHISNGGSGQHQVNMLDILSAATHGSWVWGGATTFPLAADHHLCMTYNIGAGIAEVPTVYLDGVALSLSAAAVQPTAMVGSAALTELMGATFTVGAGSFVGRWWDYGIWDRVVTAQEAASMALGYSPAFFQNGLVAYTPGIGTGQFWTLPSGTAMTESGQTNYDSSKYILPAGPVPLALPPLPNHRGTIVDGYVAMQSMSAAVTENIVKHQSAQIQDPQVQLPGTNTAVVAAHSATDPLRQAPDEGRPVPTYPILGGP